MCFFSMDSNLCVAQKASMWAGGLGVDHGSLSRTFTTRGGKQKMEPKRMTVRDSIPMCMI